MTLRHAIALVASLGLALVSGSTNAEPKKPLKKDRRDRAVEGSLTGCVIGAVFYSVYDGVQAHRTHLPDSFDLFPLEGRTVRVAGRILPGSNFKPTGDPEVVQATCAAHLVPAIRRHIAVDHRIRGQQAANRRDYKESYRLFGLAMILEPDNCDTYVDRAYVHALRGDQTAAVTDLAVLEKSECSNPHKANHLLLQDVGKVFEQQGWREGALTIYRTALAACEKRDHPDLCRDGILDNIRRVSEPKQGR